MENRQQTDYHNTFRNSGDTKLQLEKHKDKEKYDKKWKEQKTSIQTTDNLQLSRKLTIAKESDKRK